MPQWPSHHGDTEGGLRARPVNKLSLPASFFPAASGSCDLRGPSLGSEPQKIPTSHPHTHSPRQQLLEEPEGHTVGGRPRG